MRRARALMSYRVGPQSKPVGLSRSRLFTWGFAGLICCCFLFLFVDFKRRTTPVAVPEPPPPVSIDDLRRLYAKKAADNTTEVLEEAQATRCFTQQCTVPPRSEELSEYRLTIGIVSDPISDASFRQAVRETWMQEANALDGVQALFFFPQNQASAMAAEAEQHGDVLIASQADESMPIGFQLVTSIAQRFSTSTIMRVSVRSYIMPQRIVDRLTNECRTKQCEDDPIWAGQQLVTSGTQGTLYKRDTGLDDYLPSMASPAYIISKSLATSLHLMHEKIGLKRLSDDEGLSMGLWLIPMPVQRIDLSQTFRLGDPCCVLDSDAPRMVVDVCEEVNGQRPLVLATLARPEYVTLLHERAQRCR